jgi:hypothetical protein
MTVKTKKKLFGVRCALGRDLSKCVKRQIFENVNTKLRIVKAIAVTMKHAKID